MQQFLALASAITLAASLAHGAQKPAAKATDSARHFRLTITKSNKLGAFAGGGFYDLAPGKKLPPPMPISIDGQLGPDPLQSTWKPVSKIFIRGLVPAIRHGEWRGMLEPDGLYHYSTFFGGRSVPAYKLSQASDPVTGRFGPLHRRTGES